MSRTKTFDAIKANPEVSVLVIGGGVNGIGTFRDLALQGVDVLLVEMNDFCSGASAASSHMVHGGIRYLENGEFRLVREALTERNRLLQNAAHMVKPLPTTIPLYKAFSGLFNAPLKFVGLRDKPSERGAIVIKAGLMMYDLFTRGQQTLPTHKFYGRKASLQRRPDLNPDIMATATYYDAWMPYPERICIDLIMDAEAANEKARALNYVKAVSADGDTVTIEDRVTGETYDIRPQVVVNAGGPWIDFVNENLDRGSRFIGGTKGSHILVDHDQLHDALQGQEIFFENADGRIVLIFPLKDRVIIGTTDIRIDNPDDAECTEEEVDYMLELVRKVFPNIAVKREDIVYRFSGVRPLPASEAGSTGQISRDHSIRAIEPGATISFPVLSLVGGKWTTFRAFSEEVADDVLKRINHPRKLRTADVAIGGGKDYPIDRVQAWISDKKLETGLSRERLDILLDRYGTRANEMIQFMLDGDDAPLESYSDYTRLEIVFVAAKEKVVHIDDLLQRRSLLAMLGKVDGAVLREIADILAVALGWDDDHKQAEIERTIKILTSKHGIAPEKLEAPAPAAAD